MAIVPISNMGQIGLISDVALHDQPLNAVSELQNARPYNRAMESIFNFAPSGYFGMTSGAFGIGFFERNNNRYWITGSGSTVRAHNGTTGVNLRSIYNATAVNGWQFNSFQGQLVYNNGIEVPQFWNGTNFTANAGADLTNWPAANRCRVMRSFKQFLIALYITEGSSVFSNRIAWGDPAEPNALPVTWDPADDTRDAGWYDIADTPGALLDCAPLGDTNIVYKTDGIWGQVYTANEQVFRFFKISSSIGALGINCIAAVPGGHIVLANGDVILVTGQGDPRSLVNERVRNRIFSRMTADNSPYAFVLVQPRYEEVWLCLPSDTIISGTYPCVEAYTINWRTGAIGHRDLSNVYAGDIGYPSPAVSGLTYDTVAGDYDAYGNNPYNQTIGGENTLTPAMVGLGSSSIMLMDFYNVSIAIPTFRVERTQLAIAGIDKQNNPIVDASIGKIFANIWPYLEIEGKPLAVFTTVGGQSYFAGPVTWKDAHVFNPNTGAEVVPTKLKISCFVNSPLPAYKIEVQFQAKFAKIRFSGFSIEVFPSGKSLSG